MPLFFGSRRRKVIYERKVTHIQTTKEREGDHIIIFKINSKIFTKFNIAYVAGKKRY